MTLTASVAHAVYGFRSAHYGEEPNELRMNESTLRAIATENDLHPAGITGATMLGIPITLDDRMPHGEITVARTETVEALTRHAPKTE